MWICSRLGFFSVVQKAPDCFHVRARCRRDLVNLKREARMRGAKIHRTDPADYRFRIIMDSHDWELASIVLFESVEYSNFKACIAAAPDQADKLAAYSAFHHDLAVWQDRKSGRKRKPLMMLTNDGPVYAGELIPGTNERF